MTLFLQQALDGLASGALYGALALSIVLVFRASGTVNFAQGEMAVAGAFIAWQLVQWQVPIWLAILLAVAASLLLGVLVERLFIRPIGHDANAHFSLIIVTLGLMLVVNSLVGWQWGYLTKEFPPLFGQGAVSIAGARLSFSSIGILVTVALMSLALYALFRHTRVGLQMRAAVNNPEAAGLSGINVGTMLAIGWGLAAGIGAVVAILAAPQLFLQPNMFAPILLYAFAAAVLGGMDSPVGALVGGLIVGVVETLAGAYISFIGNDFKQAVALLLILGVLLLRPQGLFGRKVVQRV